MKYPFTFYAAVIFVIQYVLAYYRFKFILYNGLRLELNLVGMLLAGWLYYCSPGGGSP